ncbi:unnamed protein product, partial [Rotaria sordida]
GFSSPLIDGVPKPNFSQTENFDQLESWFNKIDEPKFINLYMLKSLVLSDPQFILAAYGSNNKAKAIEILKRFWFSWVQYLELENDNNKLETLLDLKKKILLSPSQLFGALK